MSRSTVALVIFVTVMMLGAILVAREMRGALRSPAGQRLASIERLKNLKSALDAYRAAHGDWPDTRLQATRDRRMAVGAFAGLGYRKPRPGDAPATPLLWRELPLDGVRAGEPWAGPDQPAERDMPAVGHLLTQQGEVLALEVPEFRRRLAEVGADVARE